MEVTLLREQLQTKQHQLDMETKVGIPILFRLPFQ